MKRKQPNATNLHRLNIRQIQHSDVIVIFLITKAVNKTIDTLAEYWVPYAIKCAKVLNLKLNDGFKLKLSLFYCSHKKRSALWLRLKVNGINWR